LGAPVVLDTIVASESPEGIVLRLRPAGLSVRFYAFLLDWGVRLIILSVTAIVAAIAGGLGTAFWLILFFVLEWFYPVLFELWHGATPGKRAFGLRVVMDNGLPITPGASMTRNVLRAADFLPFLYGSAIVTMLVRADAKRLGDVAAGTLVVHEPLPGRVDAATDAAPVPPTRPLTQQQQAALMALAVRAPRLSIARVDELAEIAAAATTQERLEGPALTARVLGIGGWLLGKRP
jgi:uncharacterized RDD family membrane protein YckC